MGLRTVAIGVACLLGWACGDDGDGFTCTGSDDPDALRGSFCEGSEISWDTVELGWFEGAQSLRIRYGVQEEDRVSPRFQIQVLGTEVNLEADVRIDLTSAGFVQRWPEGASDPQNLTSRLEASSNLVFDELQLRVAGRASGRFDLLLSNGRTLRGQFDGELRDLSPPGG